MNLRIQIIIGIVVIFLLVVIVNMIRKRRLELRYALAWLGAGAGILILNCFPMVTTWTAKKMGIASPINFLFLAGFCFSLLLIFVMTVALSRMSIRIKQLAQETAFLEEKIRKQEEKAKTGEGKEDLPSEKETVQKSEGKTSV